MSKPHKILVVDDEPDLQPLVLQRMRREIRNNTYEFAFASDGILALDKLNEDEDIDIVLSDINMPKMDGLTLLEQIPSVNPNIRSVIVSAYGDMKNIRKAMNRGAFDFITKPIDFMDLKTTIERTAKHLELWRDALAARDKLTSINNELSIADKMQQSILPRIFPSGENYKLAGTILSAKNVGGDFFDIINCGEGKFGVVIADVSGRGVPAAMFMMSSRTLIKGAAIGNKNPSDVLKEVNRLLVEDNLTGMFVSVFYCVVDTITGQISYSNGGHNPPLIVKPDGSSMFLTAESGVALGMFEEIEFKDHQFALEPNDRVVFYTNGITETMNSKDELFGINGLRQAVKSNKDLNIAQFNEAIVGNVREFSKDVPQSDDLTCISLRYDGPVSPGV
ncbi:MAG: SpoIIE family protein phosphatase [Rhodobacteraceae bacterium]|nr:SpoIIE family protein phosphatase [Paracoccaceae bacterium]MCY4249749.1 SpoIIE family protein phosphatase [Paracoccaceae bacterium]MCY4306776.1 SpoIIE family protein phosphatase [Paracoccaceae bacterium]